MTEQETHQGPGVYGGLETHRGARQACPAPDCGPQGVRITPNPDNEDAVLVHFPDIDYLNTQVWSADIGISMDALRELRDAIDRRLGDSAEVAELRRERDVLRRSLARLAQIVAQVAAFGLHDSRRPLLREKWLTADRVLAYCSGPADGCDCDRTAFRRSEHAGHLVTCPLRGHGRNRHYGKKASR